MPLVAGTRLGVFNGPEACTSRIGRSNILALGERTEAAEVCKDKHSNPEPDTDLRDNENIPLREDITAYMEREVLPHVPDAWVDESKTEVGYEIPFTRHFYEYTPPRSHRNPPRRLRDPRPSREGRSSLIPESI